MMSNAINLHFVSFIYSHFLIDTSNTVNEAKKSAISFLHASYGNLQNGNSCQEMLRHKFDKWISWIFKMLITSKSTYNVKMWCLIPWNHLQCFEHASEVRRVENRLKLFILWDAVMLRNYLIVLSVLLVSWEFSTNWLAG